MSGAEELIAGSGSTRRPLSSSLWGLPYRILNISHKEELLRGLWVEMSMLGLALQGILESDSGCL